MATDECSRALLRVTVTHRRYIRAVRKTQNGTRYPVCQIDESFVITTRYDPNEITLCIVNEYTCTECVLGTSVDSRPEIRKSNFFTTLSSFKKKLKCKTFIIIARSSKIVQHGVLHKRSKLLIKKIGKSCKNEKIFERRDLRKL